MLAAEHADAARKLSAELGAADPAWWAESRAAALADFVAAGLPGPRDEVFKYTPTTRLSKAPFFSLDAPAEGAVPDLEALGLADLDAARAVFVDGRFDAGRSSLDGLPEGVVVRSLAAVMADDPASLKERLGAQFAAGSHSLQHLNAALVRDGLVLDVPAGVALERPIHAVFLTREGAGHAAYPRLLVRLGRGAAATLIESYHGGAGAYLVDVVSEVELGENAQLTHWVDQRQGREATHIAGTRARQARDSRWDRVDVHLGGRLVRSDVATRLGGVGAAVSMHGLQAGCGEQHLESFTEIDHAVPRCESREFYKSILDDKARGVFRGRVVVREDAQLSDSEQQNKTLLLSDKAEIDTKPELEIYADDVKAAHGATIGQLDPDALFFLRSRGIAAPAARQMLVRAFAVDLLGHIADETLREALAANFDRRFHGGKDPE